MKSEEIATEIWTKVRVEWFREARENSVLRRLFGQRKKLEKDKEQYKVGLRQKSARGVHGVATLKVHNKTKKV